MSIEFNCGACGKLLRVPDGSGGKQAKCPHCNTVMRIPESSSDPPEPDDPFAGSSSPQAFAGSDPEGSHPEGSDFGSNAPSDDPLGFSDEDAFGREEAAGQNPFAEPPAGSSYGAGSSGGTFFDKPTGQYGMHPHRAGMVLTFGIISIVSSGLGVVGCCCCLFAVLPVAGIGFGIPAWMMGKADLEKMSQGLMDPTGHSNTKAGMTTGMIGTILGAAMLLGTLGLFILQVVFNIGSASFQNGGF